MSVLVMLHCDREHPESRCPASVVVEGAETTDQARTAAKRYGWHHSGAGDRCPTCSGSRIHCPWAIRA